MSVLRLGIGCGEKKRPDMIGLDFRRTASVDIVADARNLPFRSESFDHVLSSRVIEHFSHRVLHKLMAEWVRVLRKVGRIEIRCPDLRARALMFFLSPTMKNIASCPKKSLYGKVYTLTL